jgi:hypothetical protein
LNKKQKINKEYNIVGTGLARLPEVAPKTFEYL